MGGRPSRDKAASDVVALCQADSGKTCSVTLAGSDVYIALTMGDGVMGGAASASSATAAQKRALDLCRKTHKRCSKAGLFDLVAEQALRYDPEAFGKPWFTAQSWTKSGKGKLRAVLVCESHFVVLCWHCVERLERCPVCECSAPPFVPLDDCEFKLEFDSDMCMHCCAYQ